MKKVIKILVILLVLAIGCQQNQNIHQMTKLQSEVYTCPMHPSVISDRPGACPVCGMALVKKTSLNNQTTDDITKLKSVSLSPTQRVLANVATYEVSRKEITYKINAFGIVDIAEPNYHIISSRYSGRIEKLYANSLGHSVQKGEILFNLYSPELISAQNELLLAIKNKQAELIQIIREKLINHYGLTEKQTEEIENSKVVLNIIPYHSPVSGIIVQKEIQEGQYVENGMILYRIADISKVWINFDVYEKDIQHIKINSTVEVTLNYSPNKLQGKVTFIYPEIDQETRTVRVRTEFKNSDASLKPKTFVTGTFFIKKKNTIVVPVSAVLYTGKREKIWVEVSENVFEPRDVVTGIKNEYEVEILEGLKAGEKVVVSGGYLIDSESNFQMPQNHTGHEINLKQAQTKNQAEDFSTADEVTVVVDGKYTPSTIVTKKGKILKINFERHDEIKCTDEVVFPDFKIKKYLPPHRTTTIELELKKSGEYIFHCGMDMIQGRIIVKD